MSVENLLERLLRLVAEAVRARRFENKTDFLRRAGLTSGYWKEFEGRISRNPKASISGNTARRFAELLGVSVETLLSGQSTDEPPFADKYESRAFAARAARDLQFPEAAIQVVLNEDPGTDPGRMYWFLRIQAEAERIDPTAQSGSHKI